MTETLAIAHVNEAIAKALRDESYIDSSVLDIKGFSTATQRHLVSNLAHLPKENPTYLEIGLYAGGTFCAALSNNPDLRSTGIEDWSQSFGDATVYKQFVHNFTAHYKPRNKGWLCQTLTEDCFGLQSDLMWARRGGYDLYYYDGEHSLDSQAKALPHFIDAMADTFIFLVDDFAWEPVHTGTRAGFDALAGKIKIEQEWILTDGVPDGPLWHNDVYLSVISKL